MFFTPKKYLFERKQNEIPNSSRHERWKYNHRKKALIHSHATAANQEIYDTKTQVLIAVRVNE